VIHTVTVGDLRGAAVPAALAAVDSADARNPPGAGAEYLPDLLNISKGL
jgi:hypothetical protein